jgi:hypothetical protein
MQFQKPTTKPTRYMVAKAKDLIETRKVKEADYVAKFRRGYKTAARKAYRIARKDGR